MFLTLLAATLAISLAVCAVTLLVFRRPILSILGRIVQEEISRAWWRYLMFAIVVVGVSGGVRVWDLEKYITPRPDEAEAITLSGARWTLEVYRTLLGTLQSIAWVLLVFFVIALIAYVIVRGQELRRRRPTLAAQP